MLFAATAPLAPQPRLDLVREGIGGHSLGEHVGGDRLEPHHLVAAPTGQAASSSGEVSSSGVRPVSTRNVSMPAARTSRALTSAAPSSRRRAR